MKLGQIEVHFINDGFWTDDGGAMFGVVPREVWSRQKQPNARNRIRMSLICPLVIEGRSVVLVDTGAGTRLSEKERAAYEFGPHSQLVSSLERIGIEPEDVTVVVLSHLHFDHCGGVVRTTDTGQSVTFPKARHLLQRREWEAATNAKDPRSRAAYGHVAQCLEPLRAAGLLELIDGETKVTEAVNTILTGGHSRGHQCVTASGPGGGLLYLGDLAPTSAHLKPAWTMAYDVDPLGTVEAKRRLLELALEKGWWVAFDHDDSITHGRLVRAEGSGEPVLGEGSAEIA